MENAAILFKRGNGEIDFLQLNSLSIVFFSFLSSALCYWLDFDILSAIKRTRKNAR